jgi:mannonate dehydratase
MEQCWRWFGPKDPIPLEHVRQAGATGIVTALHDHPPGVRWSSDAILKRKAAIEDAGLRWSVCESIPVPDAVKLGGAKARLSLDAWTDTLAALGRAGVPTVCYNFMPVVDWTRTDLRFRVPSGGLALRFDWTDFVAYDVCILRRRGSEGDYPATLVSAARARREAMSESEAGQLETTIIAGLPGGAEALTRETLRERIALFSDVSADDMRSALADFLKAVVPVAEEVGVRLAIHPDDPPFSLFGLPRVVSTAEDARFVLAAAPAVANGLTMCVGSYGARADNDIVAMTRQFAPRIHFAHLRNVARELDGSFHEAEHLDGDTDMIAVIEALMREEADALRRGEARAIPMRPDHGHLLGDDAEKPTNPGYSYIGRLKGLGELRGAMRAIGRTLQ